MKSKLMATSSSVSVIIPAYNSEQWIAEAISSALAQRQCNVEVIVVDDGSTDGTREAVLSFGDRVSYITQPNSGPAVARNTGVAVASNAWIAFLDADDIWHEDKLRLQLDIATAENVPIVYTNVRNFGDDQRVAELRLDPQAMPSGDILTEILMDNFITLSTVMMKRELFDEIGGFRSEFFGTEDWDLWLRFAIADVRFGACRDALVEYRWVGSSVSKNHQRMKSLRQKTLDSAFQSMSNRAVDQATWQQAYANMLATSAWFIEAVDPKQAFFWSVQSLMKWPRNLRHWKAAARQAVGITVELTRSSSAGCLRVA